ncbi:hypothetical protein RHABOEDO_001260 [Candidatus Rhabdochlamydia oedothoracis]|uniref:Transposase n=1 Tax=Candidatus Rhabdochlamydia oedothoracis TaxID=2720720 RepID=A0ABX8V1E5_9BACT|nr:hypothetical protein RHOW815_001105 [Candidatus Rhabdochlamydia sp. W815]QYF49009.1 hypothetical protein RHABOEDO_001260 [Candidatus Rhabdochlamydia oedothoracis]
MEKLVELYCSIEDFWKDFNKQREQHLITKGKFSRGPKGKMSLPEMALSTSKCTKKIFYVIESKLLYTLQSTIP